MSARVEINEIVNENDALKMEVAKARYSEAVNPEEESLSDAEKDEMNTLMVENEELKKEVRKIRYAPPPSSPNALFDQQPGVETKTIHWDILTAAPENVTDFDVADDMDEGFVEVEHEEELLPLPRPKLPLQDQYDGEEDEVELDKVRPAISILMC